MKKILGLDLGTNSIGWALIEQDFEAKKGKILGMGSRIIPMTQDIKDEFGKGNSISQTADRTGFRGTRRLRERHLLRRERLHRILNILGFLPEHYANQIDFEKRLGKFKEEREPKIGYQEIWNSETKKNDFDFIFKDSFEEMLADFRNYQPQLLGNNKRLPYDWTIYYLRKKALSQKITKEELAWILLNFNQKRGYYQLRGEEEEENPNKLIEFYSLKIINVIADEKANAKGETWYSLHLENGWIYRRSSKTSLQDWTDKVRDFIVTTDLNDDGSIKTDKEGNEKRSFRAPSEDDWTLIKKKTEQEIDRSEKTVGTYIYDKLLQKPNQKINGKLIRTIERKFYKEELKAILEHQLKEHPELENEDFFNDCIRELYRNNESHQTTLSKKDFVHLFLNDIIFYQRPLKSQKSSIGNCALEYRKFKTKDKEGNEIEKTEYLKAIPKSNPFYQEFRVWQWLYNLKIYKKEDDTDVTEQFIKSAEDLENLFAFLMTQKEVDHKDILKFLFASSELKSKVLSNEMAKYSWNYVYNSEKDESKKYPCNETGYEIRRRLAKVENITDDFLTNDIEFKLWHLIYSVTDKEEFEKKALKKFANKHSLDETSFVENFRKFPPFKSEYGSFSEKAIKKLLPLLRLGKYWHWENIDIKTKDRIDKIITGEYDEEIKNRVREKAIHLTKESDFRGLQLWLAQYVVYDRHSEASLAGKWNSVSDLENYLEEFKQHSLRNPIVEQVVTETLRVVKDIWAKYGSGAKDFFNEIHIELGRDMKNTADERKRLTNIVSDNEATNLRIKLLLTELKDNSDGKLQVEEVRPFSPPQQEILKIYEDGVLNSNVEVPDDILKISKTAQPSKSELQRYKLWLEQKYRSPYTGQLIPMSKLFTHEYEIEHVIPQSRFFDDSFSNKVICESAVNKLKDKQLGLEFIKNHSGEKVETGFGKSVEIFSEEAYKEFIKEHYTKNRSKKNKLLLEGIPEKMIERQLNDTRYIGKFISNVLSNIVRSDSNDDGINSKNILPGNGKITTALKQDWGLNDVWNDLVLPRFERMNLLTNSTAFTAWNENYQKFLPTIPLEFSKGFQKKRIDHRHHAMDALVIACATRDHINYMNNEHSIQKSYKKMSEKEKESYRFDLKKNLCYKKYNEGSDQNYKWIFHKPWDNFTKDTKDELDKTVISFKQNLRIINKTSNKYESYKDENGNLRIGKDGKPKKDLITQAKGDSWAIRKPMHKDTVSGLVSLRKKKEVLLSVALENYNEIVDKELRKEILKLVNLKYDKKLLTKFFKDRQNKWNNKDISRVEIYFWDNDNVASRVSLDTSFNEKRITETITDTGIQKILLTHLKNYKNRFDEKNKEIAPETLAFTPEGIEEMNKNIVALNKGKFHQPILKVRTYESKGNKFNIGLTGNKKDKFVEAAKGTNLFFAIYQDENGKRSYETIPLNIVIERQKQGLDSVPETNEKGAKLLFHLSPNDLVYVPTNEEKENIAGIDFRNLKKEQTNNLYKIVSFTGTRLYSIPLSIATVIVNKVEFAQLNKIEFTKEKEIFIKLKTDRLGEIINFNSDNTRNILDEIKH